MKIFNTLGREEQELVPINDHKIGMYTCGPTVYHYVTIGNWRTYVLSDITYRTLKFLGYDVKYVMNITDVGHLAGDNEGDSSIGEDRMSKAEKREGKTAWEIAEFYANDFFEGMAKLNLVKPDVIPKPTEHIPEQIELVQEIINRGYAYVINDGIYFDVEKYESDGFTYGELSNLDQIKEGARVTINEHKKDPRDFALWKFSPTNEQRHMEWSFDFVISKDGNNFAQDENLHKVQVETLEDGNISIKGDGFPGWHIECSAMGMKYLGEQFDIHIGGEDLKSTHHPCEIAQSESATEKSPFVKYWIHGAFLLVDGGRMGKSLGNAYTIQDLEERGYDPLDLRYFYFSGHYSKKLNFTFESLDAAKNARNKLANKFRDLAKITNYELRITNDLVDDSYISEFKEALEDNLNMPKVLASFNTLLKSDLDPEVIINTALEFDKVLGLGFDKILNETRVAEEEYSDEIKSLIESRNEARENKDWTKADSIRDRLKNEFGIEVKDQ